MTSQWLVCSVLYLYIYIYIGDTEMTNMHTCNPTTDILTQEKQLYWYYKNLVPFHREHHCRRKKHVNLHSARCQTCAQMLHHEQCNCISFLLCSLFIGWSLDERRKAHWHWPVSSSKPIELWNLFHFWIWFGWTLYLWAIVLMVCKAKYASERNITILL